ncbi:anti-sigma regulatory factor (Ser/Thr protein kinase) [Actinoplanes campanulatus]|uniref:Anti-sigma regulatory factor (Ser/Thr protein kinase) n=1 Tax=Actinoplanes campanulatus TaxID=113559 RepID=A0A7W5AGF1_9ACTN|nr:ATP-binding protein [Actinoplanes campanulatus]MBB3095602.1 anti-sigma regulatory factor (Ser/Thr protein kinase) [Actinoplanes campanulatus]
MIQIPSGTPGEPPYRTVALAPDPDAASLARTLVADACMVWQLPGLLHPARRVMSELVLNAVEHAATALVVTVTRHGDGLHLAVSDGDPRLPRLRMMARVRRGVPLDERGRGLQLVQAAATRWGADRTATGKTVWAVLLPKPARQPRPTIGAMPVP